MHTSVVLRLSLAVFVLKIVFNEQAIEKIIYLQLVCNYSIRNLKQAVRLFNYDLKQSVFLLVLAYLQHFWCEKQLGIRSILCVILSFVLLNNTWTCKHVQKNLYETTYGQLLHHYYVIIFSGYIVLSHPEHTGKNQDSLMFLILIVGGTMSLTVHTLQYPFLVASRSLKRL